MQRPSQRGTGPKPSMTTLGQQEVAASIDFFSPPFFAFSPPFCTFSPHPPHFSPHPHSFSPLLMFAQVRESVVISVHTVTPNTKLKYPVPLCAPLFSSNATDGRILPREAANVRTHEHLLWSRSPYPATATGGHSIRV